MSALVSLLAISTPFSLASATSSAFSMPFKSVLVVSTFGASTLASTFFSTLVSTLAFALVSTGASAFLAGAFFLTAVLTCVPAAAFASKTALATSLA